MSSPVTSPSHKATTSSPSRPVPTKRGGDVDATTPKAAAAASERVRQPLHVDVEASTSHKQQTNVASSEEPEESAIAATRDNQQQYYATNANNNRSRQLIAGAATSVTKITSSYHSSQHQQQQQQQHAPTPNMTFMDEPYRSSHGSGAVTSPSSHAAAPVATKEKSSNAVTSQKPHVPPLDLSILHEHGDGSGESLRR